MLATGGEGREENHRRRSRKTGLDKEEEGDEELKDGGGPLLSLNQIISLFISV